MFGQYRTPNKHLQGKCGELLHRKVTTDLWCRKVPLEGCCCAQGPWHGPADVRGPNAPKWRDKLQADRDRDVRAADELKANGWRVLRGWECEVRCDALKAAQAVAAVVQEATGSSSGSGSA